MRGQICDSLSGEGADENGQAEALARAIADGTLACRSIAGDEYDKAPSAQTNNIVEPAFPPGLIVYPLRGTRRSWNWNRRCFDSPLALAAPIFSLG